VYENIINKQMIIGVMHHVSQTMTRIIFYI